MPFETISGENVHYFNEIKMDFEERLIQKIRENDFLCNKSNKNFKNTFLKEKKWKEIAKELNIPVQTAKKKWRCIKDRYHRTKKSAASGSAAKDKKPYKFACLLSFLDRSENSNGSTASNYSEVDNKGIITLDNGLVEFLSEVQSSEEDYSTVFTNSCTSSTNKRRMVDETLTNNTYQQLIKVEPQEEECYTDFTNCCTSSTNKRRLVDETLINNTGKELIKLEQQIPNESQKKTKEQLFCESLAIQIMEAGFPPERFRSVQRRILEVLDQEVNEMKMDTYNIKRPID